MGETVSRRFHRRRLRWAILIVLAVVPVLAAAGWLLSGATPAWYRQSLTAVSQSQAREMQAHAVEEQLHALQTWADATYVQQLARSRGRTLAVPPPSPTFTLEFTETQLNAFAAKWAMLAAGESLPIAEPAVRLDANAMQIGVKLPGWVGLRVVSAGLRAINDAGTLEAFGLKLGLLPLPMSLLPDAGLEAERRRTAGKIKMDAGGQGNEAAVTAGACRIAMELLAGRLRETRCFLPAATPIPVRVEHRLEPQRLVLTLTPLDAQEREAYVQELQGR